MISMIDQLPFDDVLMLGSTHTHESRRKRLRGAPLLFFLSNQIGQRIILELRRSQRRWRGRVEAAEERVESAERRGRTS